MNPNDNDPYDQRVSVFGVDVPPWVDKDIDANMVKDLAKYEERAIEGAIYCVFPHDALAIMAEHGQAVSEYIDEQEGDDFAPKSRMWPDLAVEFVSHAVLLWAREAWRKIEEYDHEDADACDQEFLADCRRDDRLTGDI